MIQLHFYMEGDQKILITTALYLAVPTCVCRQPFRSTSSLIAPIHNNVFLYRRREVPAERALLIQKPFQKPSRLLLFFCSMDPSCPLGTQASSPYQHTTTTEPTG